MGDEKVREHLRLAISFEERLIRLRERQIAGYKKRIELMKQGYSYGSSIRAVPGISANLKFDWNEYSKKKNKVAKHGK